MFPTLDRSDYTCVLYTYTLYIQDVTVYLHWFKEATDQIMSRSTVLNLGVVWRPTANDPRKKIWKGPGEGRAMMEVSIVAALSEYSFVDPFE